jgi:hypothetical protein
MLKHNKKRKNEREYIPVNSQKYIGGYPIITRSTWEYKFCEWLDYNRNVIEWSSESHKIGYIDPIDGRHRRYYPDFYARMGNDRFIIEVKPEKDLRMPKKGKKSVKTMMIREQNYLVNKAKFKAAERYCQKLGYKFMVLTEKQLFRGK